MYKIIYEKQNGEVFERIRNTIPDTGIGQTTSMGWRILNIQYSFGNGYYDHAEYCRLMSKVRKPLLLRRRVIGFYKKYKDIFIILLTIIATRIIM